MYLSTFECLCQICAACDKCIVIGDFNLPKINWKDSYFPGDFKYNVFYNFYTDYGFNQLISEPTRNDNILDLLLTNDPLLISDYSIDVPFCKSDHESINWVVILDICHTERPQVSETIPIYNWSLACWDSFASYLNYINWFDEFSSCKSSNDYLNLFMAKLWYGIKQFVPRSHSKQSSNVAAHCKAVQTLSNKRKRLWKSQRQSPSTENKCKYQAFTTAFRVAIDREAAANELKVIKSGNLGSFYKHINNRLNHKSGIAPLVDDRGKLCVSNYEKAEVFSQYFATVGVVDNGVVPLIADSDVNSQLSSIYFDSASVYSVIINVNDKAAVGPDNTPPVVYKNLVFSLLYPLTILFNIIMQLGVIPCSWTIAIVVSTFKKGIASKPTC